MGLIIVVLLVDVGHCQLFTVYTIPVSPGVMNPTYVLHKNNASFHTFKLCTKKEYGKYTKTTSLARFRNENNFIVSFAAALLSIPMNLTNKKRLDVSIYSTLIKGSDL